MSENCTHDCSTCGSDCAERSSQPASMLEKPLEGSKVKKVIAVVSGKGGVGKSLVTSMLAVLMNRRGYSTAILDADVTGPSIPKSFGIKTRATGDDKGIDPVMTKHGIKIMSVNLLLENDTDPVVWRGPIIAGTALQFWNGVYWGDVDFMFVDMPPGTGDVPLTVFQSLPVDGIVVVATPSELVSMIVEKAENMAKLMNIPTLALVENMSYFECPDCGKRTELFGKSHADENAKQFGIDCVAKLPIDPKLAAGVDAGMVELFDGAWLDSLADKIEKLLEA